MLNKFKDTGVYRLSAKNILNGPTKAFLMLFLLGWGLNGMQSIHAQFGEEFDAFRKIYPEEYQITYLEENELIFKVVKDSLLVHENNKKEEWVLSDKALVSASRSIPYSGFNELVELEAYSLIPANGKYKKVKVKEFNHKDDLDNSIFYDDYKSANFRFPSVSQGVKTITNYRYQINNPRFVSKFYFNNYVPIVNGVFKVRFPDDVKIKYKMFNCDSTKITFTKEKKGSENLYTWTVNSPKKMKYESGGLNPIYHIPHIVVYIESYENSKGTQEIYSDVKKLYDWYYSLVEPVNSEARNNKELVAITDSITAGLDNDLDKMKAIYYWVQNNINYVAFENGMEGFVPRPASNVCELRYGDCKGMTSIIVGMAQIANLDAHYTWIGSNSIPYTYTEMPTLAVDNHMIATFIDKDSNYYFLDATNDFLKFGTPSSFIQGKEALISIDKERFKIYKVPYTDYKENRIKDSINIRFEGDNIVGSGIAEISGYYKGQMTKALLDMNEKDKKLALSSYLEKGSNKFDLTSFELENLEDRDTPLKIRYNFNLSNYMTSMDNETYINLFLDKIMNYAKIEKDRETSLSYGFRNINEISVALQLPENSSISYLPKNSTFTNDLFSFSSEYHKNPQSILLNYSIIQNLDLLEKNKFEDWNSMINTIRKSYGESIIITR